MPYPIQLGVLDSHVLFRKALKNFLSVQTNLHVSCQASNIFELQERLKTSVVDVLVMDVFFPEVLAIDAVRLIRSAFPRMRILILSASTDVSFISEFLDLGIHCYLCKSVEPEELLEAIRSVAENRIYRNNLLTEALYYRTRSNMGEYSNDAKLLLSDREKKILQLIWEEMSNEEIARNLFLSVRSVEKIRQDMKAKIGARSTVGLMKYAIANRIIADKYLLINAEH
jgi:DNA-binding NarL/FixJ family response regulator